MPKYLHLRPDDDPPLLEPVGPFKAVIAADVRATPEWQAQISDWLVRSGCRYMMAWGLRCGDWESSVDVANSSAFNGGKIPEDDLVITTSHQSESLQETFWFSERVAVHGSLELARTYLIHVSPDEQEAMILETFCKAQNEDK